MKKISTTYSPTFGWLEKTHWLILIELILNSRISSYSRANLALKKPPLESPVSIYASTVLLGIVHFYIYFPHSVTGTIHMFLLWNLKGISDNKYSVKFDPWLTLAQKYTKNCTGKHLVAAKKINFELDFEFWLGSFFLFNRDSLD